MSTTESVPPFAWEPFTPRGVAAFARGSLGRLLLVQLIVAALAAGAVVLFLSHCWFPVVREAIEQLPSTGEIRDGRLDWPVDEPALLAENHFLGLAVDADHRGQLGRAAQVQVEFGRNDLRIDSLLGYKQVPYQPEWRVPFNRPGLVPWWGAWKPFIAAGAAAGMGLGLMLAWTLLATVYFLPVRLITFMANRDLNLRQSWRLAGAALMPGALFFILAIFGYALGWIDLIQLCGAAALHFVIGWVYLFICPFFLTKPPVVSAVKKNPFAKP